jgi:uncharacterized membrane protein YbhN (UPF0104 family)
MFADDGDVVLLDPGNGDVAATDLQLRLDLAQLLAELALLVGPDRTARLAAKAVGADELVAVVPLLQPIVLYRSTRVAVRRRRDVLPALRKQLLEGAPGEDAAPVRLERVRPRSIVTLIASLVAGYLLLGQLGRVSLLSILRAADWRWAALALVLSGVTYLGAAWSLSGYVPGRLRFGPLVLAQLAGSFVTLVTPAAVGGAALNIRYLQRRKIPAAVAAASVGLSQVVAFVLHLLLLVVFAAITGSQAHSLQPPTWVYFVIAGLILIVLTVVAIPPGRRLLRARLAPVLGQVVPRLLAVMQQPRKLAEGIGGALLLTAAYILCLDACIRALGGSVPLASTAVVYLTGAALGSAVPTPAAGRGGGGAVGRAHRRGASRRPQSARCCCSAPSRSGSRSQPAGAPSTTSSATTTYERPDRAGGHPPHSQPGDHPRSRPASATTRSSSGAPAGTGREGPNGTSGPAGASGLANMARKLSAAASSSGSQS